MNEIKMQYTVAIELIKQKKEFKDKLFEKIHSGEKKEKRMRKLYEIYGMPSGKLTFAWQKSSKNEREKVIENTFNKIRDKHFSNLGKCINIEVQETQKSSIRFNIKISWRYIIMKLSKNHSQRIVKSGW